MKKVTSKRPITLIELMIAMALAMALLTFALYFYRYAVTMEAELKKEETKAFKERIFSGRLSSLFSRLYQEPFFTMPEQAGLTLGQSVVFSYDSEALSPTFHGQVVARLLVDTQKRLVLAVWQSNDLKEDNTPPPMHMEILGDNIEKLSFQFLMGYNPSMEAVAEWRPGFFLTEWKQDYKVIPSAIKMKLGDKEFAFPIAPCTKNPIKGKK